MIWEGDLGREGTRSSEIEIGRMESGRVSDSSDIAGLQVGCELPEKKSGMEIAEINQ